MLKKTRGIVLRTQDYGETHKIITIFTKDFGKISAIARGANRPKSRLRSISQLFIHGEFLLYVSKGLSTVQQGQIIDVHRHIMEDMDRTTFAAFLVELTDKLIESRQPDLFIYDQLCKTLQWINDSTEFEVPVMMYEMKLYQKGGFAPVVDHCVNCGLMQPPYTFSIQEGGVLCQNCNSIDNQAIVVNQSLIRLLSIFLHVGLERVGNISVKKDNKRLLRMILDSYYDRYGGYYLKSKKFLQQWKKLNE